jgi:hypothetical protein
MVSIQQTFPVQSARLAASPCLSEAAGKLARASLRLALLANRLECPSASRKLSSPFEVKALGLSRILSAGLKYEILYPENRFLANSQTLKNLIKMRV